jgi:hypothetical protein
MNTAPATSQPTENEDADPVGPSDGQNHDTGARVEGGGGTETPPLNFDDDEIYSGRSRAVRSGGTTHAKGGDSAPLGPPAEILSNTNEPSAGRKS